MDRDGWFDGQGIELRDAEVVNRQQSWVEYSRDSLIESGEIDSQEETIYELLRKLEPKLSDELHADLTTVLVEIEVLKAMYRHVVMKAIEEEGELLEKLSG